MSTVLRRAIATILMMAAVLAAFITTSQIAHADAEADADDRRTIFLPVTVRNAPVNCPDESTSDLFSLEQENDPCPCVCKTPTPTPSPTATECPPEPPPDPTSTNVPPPTHEPPPPTPVICDSWVFDHLGPPEACRPFDSHGHPVRFNIEKRILLASGITRYVENSFYLMSGYTGQVVGEGDYTIYCLGTPESVVRHDMNAHMARRRLDPEFIRDRKDIGEITVLEARTWGILKDSCDGVSVCPNVTGDFRHLPIDSAPHDVNPGANTVGILKIWTRRPGMAQTLFRATWKNDQPFRVKKDNGGDMTSWDTCCTAQMEWNWTNGPSKGTPEKSIDQLVAEGYLEWLPLPPGGAVDCGDPPRPLVLEIIPE